MAVHFDYGASWQLSEEGGGPLPLASHFPSVVEVRSWQLLEEDGVSLALTLHFPSVVEVRLPVVEVEVPSLAWPESSHSLGSRQSFELHWHVHAENCNVLESQSTYGA